MKTETYHCDICKGEIKKEDGRIRLSFNAYPVSSQYSVTHTIRNSYDNSIDICDKCCEKLGFTKEEKIREPQIIELIRTIAYDCAEEIMQDR